MLRLVAFVALSAFRASFVRPALSRPVLLRWLRSRLCHALCLVAFRSVRCVPLRQASLVAPERISYPTSSTVKEQGPEHVQAKWTPVRRKNVLKTESLVEETAQGAARFLASETGARSGEVDTGSPWNVRQEKKPKA